MARRATLIRLHPTTQPDPVFVICLARQVAEAGSFVVCGAQSNRACLNTVSMEAVQQQGQEQPEAIC
jgi:hypothetical protein